MARGERNPAKERRWRELVERQVASGLSVRTFCRQAGIGEASFYYWRRAIQPAEAPTPAPAFVPAVVRAAEPREAPILVAGTPGTPSFLGGMKMISRGA
jgi:transposase-like protein